MPYAVAEGHMKKPTNNIKNTDRLDYYSFRIESGGENENNYKIVYEYDECYGIWYQYHDLAEVDTESWRVDRYDHKMSKYDIG